MIDKIRQHTARKSHKCDLCGKIIEPKEKYFYRVSNHDDFMTEKFCTHCMPIIHEFWNDLEYNDFYDMSNVCEWIFDNYCYNCPIKTNDCHWTTCDILNEIRGKN